MQWSEGKAAPTGTLPEEETEAAHILPDKIDMFLAFASVPGYRYVLLFPLQTYFDLS